MRIGVFLGSYTPEMGGGFTFQESILNALRASKTSHEITCFHYREKESAPDGSLKWVRLFKPTGNRAGRPLHDAVLNHRIELVWFITPDYEPVAAPFIYILWDLQHRAQPYFPEVSVSGWTWGSREQFFQFILPRAAYVITGTQAGKNEVMNFYSVPADRIRVLTFPAPDFALRSYPSPARATPGSAPPHLFYPAQFWPHKNHVALLLALKILVEQERLDFSVVLTGSDHGNQKYVQETAAELGLSDHVHFRGFVSQSELIRLYQTSFAMVFPSFFGPDNIPPLEAFALGCPVIAARTSGADEQLGDAALLFDPRDERQLAAAIKKLHETPGLREALVERGKARARQTTANDYVRAIFGIVDEFRIIRRCWSSREPYEYKGL